MESVSPAIENAQMVAGREALLRGAWREAHEHFAAALEDRESAEAMIGLGVAGRYQFDASLALESHEAAYRLARQHGVRMPATA